MAKGKPLLDSADRKETRFDKIVSRLKNHRILVWLFVIGLGITLLRGTVGAARDLFQWPSCFGTSEYVGLPPTPHKDFDISGAKRRSSHFEFFD